MRGEALDVDAIGDRGDREAPEQAAGSGPLREPAAWRHDMQAVGTNSREHSVLAAPTRLAQVIGSRRGQSRAMTAAPGEAVAVARVVAAASERVLVMQSPNDRNVGGQGAKE